MGKAGNWSTLHLLVMLLVLSNLVISLNAISTSSRTRKLLHENRDTVAYWIIHRMEMTKESEAEDLIPKGRKDVELADYPGSGANDDHTPTTPEAGN